MKMTQQTTRAAGLLVGVAVVCAAALGAQQRGKPKFNTWRQYLGGSDSSQYSSLDQINKKNVATARRSRGRIPTGDTRTYRFNPIVVDNVMYTLAKNLSVVALDAATGKEIWTHENQGAIGDRGMNYWESADRKDRRLLYHQRRLSHGDRRRDGQDDRDVRRQGQGRSAARPAIAT